jgi:hypothetical protein
MAGECSARMNEEEWRELQPDGFYQVSSLGRICHATTGEIKQPTQTRGGELVVNLKDGSGWSVRLLRAIVADCFLGPCPANCMLQHLDANRLNCSVDNLRYVPRKFNVRDASRPADYQSRKLTHAQAQQIKRRLELGEPGVELAEEFGVSAPHISLIGSGVKWRRAR